MKLPAEWFTGDACADVTHRGEEPCQTRAEAHPDDVIHTPGGRSTGTVPHPTSSWPISPCGRRTTAPGSNTPPTTTSDVMGTGWYAARAAEVKPDSTAVVVGDGAVSLSGVIAAKEQGAERIIAMSRHASRQKLALEFGATDIVTERGERGVARVKELTNGIGADSVLECVGTQESMHQALLSTHPGGNVGFVGMPHDVQIDGQQLFFSHVGLRGGPAPVRAYLPDLIERVLSGRINPGKVFDLTLPLDEAAEGNKAMDERRAIKTLLRP
ncbi:zinc-binding dehydrogenase [Streptomyces sp. NBC_01231]|nr:zinc-binding dehydrogenase [Streptomyces sp. NBC_01231]